MLGLVHSCIDRYPLLTVGIKAVYRKDIHGKSTETIIDYAVDTSGMQRVGIVASALAILAPFYFRMFSYSNFSLRTMKVTASIVLGLAFSSGIELLKARRKVCYLSAEALANWDKPSELFARNVITSTDAARYAKSLNNSILDKPLTSTLFYDDETDEKGETEDQDEGFSQPYTLRKILQEKGVDFRVRNILESTTPENA